MKKVLTITLVLFSLIGQAQLNEHSKQIREQVPNIYNAVKAHAVGKWDGNNAMIVFTINKQCDAFFEMKDISYKVQDKDFAPMLIKWTEEINGLRFTNYSMVLFEIKRYLRNSDY